MKRLITLMAALLVLGFVVAGCGDDESSNDGSGDTAAQTVTEDEVVTDTETVTDTDTDTVTEETDTDVTSDNGGAAVPENLEQAVEQCKKNVNMSPALSEDTKNQLEEICDKAASGDQDQIREAAREVCRKVIEDTVPSGTPGRSQALEACDKNVQ